MKKWVIAVMVLILFFVPLVSAKCNGVLICNQKYECGAKDNVNPEEFGVKCTCPDPDAVHPLTRVFDSYKRMLNDYLGWIR